MTSKLIVAILGLFLFSLGASASDLAHWPDHHLPPMSLAQALDIAQKKMGSKYYCTYSSLCFNYRTREPGKDKPLVYHAVWVFNFSSVTEKTKEVQVFGTGKQVDVTMGDLGTDSL